MIKHAVAREPELAGKVFSGEDGVKYEGERFIQINDDSMPTGFLTTAVNYRHGKLHGCPAISYPDGLEEEWKDGNFVRVKALPYAER